MSTDTERFLGFAFASADLLLEIDKSGQVAFALGAVNSGSAIKDTGLIGRPWRDIVAKADAPLIEALLAGLSGSGRTGPVAVNMALNPDRPEDQKFVALSACRLQPASGITCAVSLSPPPLAMGQTTDRHGFVSRSGFENYAKRVIDAARATGINIDLAVVELTELARNLSVLDEEASDQLLEQISGALRSQSYAGSGAARIAEGRFAFIRSHGESEKAMSQRLARILSATVGAHAVRQSMKAKLFNIDPALSSLDRCMRALRYAMDNMVADQDRQQTGAQTPALAQALRQTISQAGSFAEMVAHHRFKLVYQPVVDLRSGQIHHHEALVRFEGDRSTFPLIRVAEELDLIEQLDMVVLDDVLASLKADRTGRLKLAMNLSGLSISQSRFSQQARAIIKASKIAPEKLILEVTESALIEDLDLANSYIQDFRRDGHLVCLDDFGSGASSFAYMQSLHVDVVKIDGRYIREIQGSGRDAALVRNLVVLCKELGVKTIAEMVENKAIEQTISGMGVDFGQGWLYGEIDYVPGTSPGMPPAQSLAPAKPKAPLRKG